MLRIIAGERRGHKIEGPRDSRKTRPTSDLVRESMFNILGEAVVDRPVLDLFAGTGAIGLEALSRGAKHATFVEKRRENVALVERNIGTLRYEDRSRVETGNAYHWADDVEFDRNEPIVVVLDPPYVDYEKHPKRVRRLLETLIERLPVGSLIVAEAGRRVSDEVFPAIERWDVRRYGDTRVAVYEVGSDVVEPAAQETERVEG